MINSRARDVRFQMDAEERSLEVACQGHLMEKSSQTGFEYTHIEVYISSNYRSSRLIIKYLRNAT